MRALIVVAHPLRTSLSHAVAAEVAAGIPEQGPNIVEIADLAAEGFDPRFGESDFSSYLKTSQIPPEILAEQARIDQADTLVLVYPVYWWSFPALLKGWIDRVFCNGWAYEEAPYSGKLTKKLGRLTVHLIAIGGADLRTYARHGYFGAMRTQIDHGIFDYCGAQVLTSELLLPPKDGNWAAVLETAREIGRRIGCGAAEATVAA
jgi:NAD(P)H dehydrogenase (quinone)